MKTTGLLYFLKLLLGFVRATWWMSAVLVVLFFPLFKCMD